MLRFSYWAQCPECQAISELGHHKNPLDGGADAVLRFDCPMCEAEFTVEAADLIVEPAKTVAGQP